jgi:TATA-box binding protein (TBP) (component of TFIID and TFIIIB)
MLLKYNNLTIRNVTVNDAEQLALWWNDGKIMAHAGFPNGIGQTANTIADSLKNDTVDTHRRLIIEIDNVVVGEMKERNMSMSNLGLKNCE